MAKATRFGYVPSKETLALDGAAAPYAAAPIQELVAHNLRRMPNNADP